jgi:beta-barrel assembly-enhancing protease
MCKFTQNQYIYFIVILFIILLRVSPCFAEFTIEDERKLGKEFYDKMEAGQFILKNKALNDYINKVGNLILTQTKKAPFEFRFLIVNSHAINAFATPGGYIYINKGLISAAENEAELAAVIAHEIGHANGRHIASLIEKSKKLNIATLAAIIAGAFLGGGGEATAAIAAFSVAGSSSMTLKYMREHEEEADRLGIGYLVSAGYYPVAMVDFLKIMKQNEFLSKTMPSYLLTHPGTDDRIYYIDSLVLTQYPQKGAKNIIGNFRRMQALVPLDTSDDLNTKYRQLENSLKTDPNNVDSLYILALVEDQLGQTSSALKHFQKALSLSSRDEDVLKNIGLIYLKTGEANLAQNYLLRAAGLNASNKDVMFALGKTYLDAGNYQKALDCFLKLETDSLDDDADINYQIAMAYGKLNNQGESHYYFGLHFKKEKKKESALFHFKEALNYFPKDSERSIAINKEIKELETGGHQKSFEKSKHLENKYYKYRRLDITQVPAYLNHNIYAQG